MTCNITPCKSIVLLRSVLESGSRQLIERFIRDAMEQNRATFIHSPICFCFMLSFALFVFISGSIKLKDLISNTMERYSATKLALPYLSVSNIMEPPFPHTLWFRKSFAVLFLLVCAFSHIITCHIIFFLLLLPPLYLSANFTFKFSHSLPSLFFFLLSPVFFFLIPLSSSLAINVLTQFSGFTR